jgi:hypothetical protein
VTSTPSLNLVTMNVVGTINYSTTHRLVVWSAFAAGVLGSASADASQTITLNNGGVSQSVAGSIQTIRGVSSLGPVGTVAETTAGTSHVTGSCTAAQAGTEGATWVAERSTTTPTTGSSINSAASGYTRWNTGFAASGAGQEGIVFGMATSTVAAGATVGGGTWSGFTSNVQVVSLTLALNPLGPGVTLAASPSSTVAAGTAVTLTATETGVSGTPTRAWTQLSGPTVSISGSTTTTAGITTTSADQYVLQYSVTDTNGTTLTTIQINANTSNPVPVAVVGTTNWTPVGPSSPTLVTAVVGVDDTNWDLSPAAPANEPIVWRLSPAALGSGGLTVFYRGLANGTDHVITNTVSVVDATTGVLVAGPWVDVQPVSTSFTSFSHVLTPTELTVAAAHQNNLAVSISTNAS